MNAPDRAAWLAARKSGIGGSDIAAILGLSPYKSAVDIWMDKTGRSADVEAGEAAYWGNVLEDIVAKEYAHRRDYKVQRVNVMARHPKHTWMIGNIDRAVVAEGSRARLSDDGGRLLGAQGVLECKTASAYKAGEWGREDDDDAVPTAYAAQCYWYMGVTGMDWCDIAVLIGGQRYLDKRIERDDEVINGMIERAEEFWRHHVLGDIAPEPASARDAMLLYPRDAGSQISVTNELAEKLAKLRDLKAQIKPLDDEADALADDIKTYIGEHSALVDVDGRPLATWKAPKPSQKTDWQAVAKAAGVSAEIIAAHTATTQAARRLLLKD